MDPNEKIEKMDNTAKYRRIQHGTPSRPEVGPPPLGLSLETPHFSVAHVPPHIIDLRLKSPSNFMVMQLGAARAVGAFDSDRLRPLQLGPGYPILGRTGTEFICKAASSRGVIAFHFSDAYLESLLERPPRAGGRPFSGRLPRFDHHLLHLFRMVHQALVQPQPDPLYIESLLAAGIVRTLSVIGDTRADARHPLSAERLARAEAYMRAKLKDRLTLTSIAAVAAMSVYHFARSFKAHYGRPPHQYLQQLRLDNAIHLLETTRWSLDSIASESGFSSQSHLGVNFKRQMGISPGAYRRLLMAAPTIVARRWRH